MLTDNDKITTSQAVVFLINVTLGTGILSLPRDAARIAESDGWIIVLLGGIVTFLGSLFTAALIRKYPKETFVEFSKRLTGKFFACILTIAFIIVITMTSSFVTRNFAEVMNAYMLERTPKEFIIITQLLLAVYLIRHGIEPIVRISQIMLPILVVPIIAMYLIAISKADFTELLPFMRTPVKTLAKGSLEIGLSFLGFDVLLMIGPSLRSPKRSNWIMFASIGSSLIIYLFIVIVVFATLGVEDTKVILWPGMSIIRTIMVPGGIFERLDALILALWTIASFTTISGYYYTAATAIGHLIGAKEFKHLVTLLFPWIFLISMIPHDVLNVLSWGRLLGVVNLILAILVPAFLYLISLVKNKRGKAS